MEFQSSPEVEVAQDLEPFVQKGLKFIAKGKFEAAKKHFRNEEKAEQAGFILAEPRDYIRRAPIDSKETEDKIINFCSENSMVIYDEAGSSIQLSDAHFIEPAKPTTRILHNLALIYAEEWIHVIQELKGNTLTGDPDDDVDVVKYLIQNKVPLTPEFMARHGRRGLVAVK